MTTEVDAVITWVDGSDKNYAEKLTRYCLQQGIDRKTEACAPTRFNERGELPYCVNSLLRFAPWIRTIYIVTDAQVPPIFKSLEGEKKLKLIDHRQIFAGYEKHLPSFNSLAIESLLWRIEGLANYFIYLNDDFSLIRPVSKEDFFQNNKLVLRGSWKVQREKKWRNYWKKILEPFIKIKDEDHKNLHRSVQENSAKFAGFTKHFFHLPHAPYPVMKSTFEDYFAQHPDLLAQNIRYRLRHPKQFWPISLAQHLEIQHQKIVFDKRLETITVNGACHSLSKIKALLARADTQKKVAFICLQSLDVADESTQELLLEWLDRKIIPNST